MTRILNTDKFPLDKKVTDKDYVIGTDGDNNKKTKNFLIGDLKAHILAGIDGGNGTDGDSSNQDDGISNGDGTYTWLKYSAFPNGFEVINGVETQTASMSDAPLDDDTLYIGLAYNKPTRVESTNPDDYIWSKFYTRVWDSETNTWVYTYYDIIDEEGNVTWVKYADTNDPLLSGEANGMSDNPLGKAYIGFAFNKDPELDESWVFSDYKWSKVTGNDGQDGIPIEGTTKWLWVKYSEYVNGWLNGVVGGTPAMVDNPTLATIYLGIAYPKDTFEESDNPSDYTWSSGNDITMPDGTHVWMKWAITPTSGMTDSPNEASRYIGFSLGNQMSIEADLLLPDPLSLKYSTYQWSAMYMTANGDVNNYITNVFTTTYTWLKYSHWYNGINPDTQLSDLTDTVTADTLYVGIGVHKLKKESEDPNSELATEYEWFAMGSDILIDGYYIWEKYSKYYNGFFEGDTTGLPDMHDIATTEDLYIGLSHYHLLKESEDLVNSENPKSYFWYRIVGDITNPNLNYTWVKYGTLIAGTDKIDPASMTDEIVDGVSTHKGFSFNHQFPAIADENSSNPDFYIWDLIGSDFQLPNGLWVWDKYSEYTNGWLDSIKGGTISMTDDETAEGIKYMGLLIGESISETEDRELSASLGVPARSENPDTYFWGDKSQHVTDQVWFYWIKFATSASGANMSDHPSSMSYMGIGYYKNTYVESDDPTKYVWNEIGALQDYTNLQGQTAYTWVKWTDNPTTGVLLDTPQASSRYMGLAFEKTEEETLTNGESMDYRDYQWFQFDFWGDTFIDNMGWLDHQNNLVKVLHINPTDLTNGIISEENIATYLNENGFGVAETENWIFDFGDVNKPAILDFSLDLVLSYDPESVTKTTATLFWDSFGDEAIVRYELFLAPKAPPEPFELEKDEVDLNLTGLTHSTLYTAFIRAFDGMGNWKNSNTVTFTTLIEYNDDVTPEWVSATVLENENIALEWSISPLFGATRYRLHIQAQGATNEYYAGFLFPYTNLTTALLQGLEPDTYTFYVTAYRVDTPSNPSADKVLTITTTEIPLTVPQIYEVSSTFDSVTFGIIIPTSELALVTKYKIFYKINGSYGNFLETETTGNDLIQTIAGLESAKEYAIYIKSLSATSTSEVSNTIYITTLMQFKAEIMLTKAIGTYAIYEGHQHQQYTDRVYTAPVMGAITEGTVINFYLHFKLRGTHAFEATFNLSYVATDNYANLRDFFNADVIDNPSLYQGYTIKHWLANWTRTNGYGFDVGGNSFFIWCYRDGTGVRNVTTDNVLIKTQAGILKVVSGEPLGWVRVKVEMTATNPSLFFATPASVKFNNLNVTLLTGQSYIAYVYMDANGEWEDFCIFNGVLGTTFTVKATILESSDSIASINSVTLLFTKAY